MTLYDILTAAVPGLGVILLSLMLYDKIAERIFHRRLHKMLKQQALTNGAFNSEELMLEADKLMHDEEESDNARDFAKRVYIIGRTAKSAIEGEK